MSDRAVMVPASDISRLIRQIRDQRVILDSDLAAVYGVETRALNQAVRRNRDRFPTEFLFRLTALEASDVLRLRSQTVILKAGRGHHRKYLPWPLLNPLGYEGAAGAARFSTGFLTRGAQSAHEASLS